MFINPIPAGGGHNVPFGKFFYHNFWKNALISLKLSHFSHNSIWHIIILFFLELGMLPRALGNFPTGGQTKKMKKIILLKLHSTW